ncbi:MAG: methionyl-tRNA formyltransferase, partial [Pyrinomonadaceae bacterium]
DGLIDWNFDAATIVNRIRGFQPFPTSYSFLDGRKITFWNASIGDDQSALPGAIVQIEKDSFSVACGGDSAIRVLDVQPEGKRRMSAADFLNGFRLNVGSVFDSTVKRLWFR